MEFMMNSKANTFIGIWNVKTLYKARALVVMMYELKRYEWKENHQDGKAKENSTMINTGY